MKKISGSVTAPRGFLAQGVCADLKKSDKKDIALIYSEVPCTAAGTPVSYTHLTRNQRPGEAGKLARPTQYTITALPQNQSRIHHRPGA